MPTSTCSMERSEYAVFDVRLDNECDGSDDAGKISDATPLLPRLTVTIPCDRSPDNDAIIVCSPVTTTTVSTSAHPSPSPSPSTAPSPLGAIASSAALVMSTRLRGITLPHYWPLCAVTLLSAYIIFTLPFAAPGAILVQYHLLRLLIRSSPKQQQQSGESDQASVASIEATMNIPYSTTSPSSSSSSSSSLLSTELASVSRFSMDHYDDDDDATSFDWAASSTRMPAALATV